MMRRLAQLMFCFSIASLSGCTTIASGVAVAPPGINRYSFRECLLAYGFYSPSALTGIALRDWHYRHVQPVYKPNAERFEVSRYLLLEQKDAAFVALAAKLISDGLMPAEEFWDRRITDQQPSTGPVASTAGAEPHFDDKGLNAPYVDIPAPQQYDFSLTPKGDNPPVQSRPSAGDPRARDWRLNRFLDCYIAPVGVKPIPSPGGQHDLSPAVAMEYGDDDLEGRLLRGHILLALLTRYGTELVVSHPSRRQVAQAELLLGHVKDAEASLRGASVIMDEKARSGASDLLSVAGKNGKSAILKDGKPYEAAAGKPLLARDGNPVPIELATLAVADKRGQIQLRLAWTDFATRLLRVFQVGVDVERIDGEQSLDRASNLIAAFSGGGGGFVSILKDGLSGLVTVQKVRIYGDAYLRDARETLAVVRGNTRRDATGAWTYSFPAFAAGWSLWDREIERSCQVLATIAKKDASAATCIPSTATPETGS